MASEGRPAAKRQELTDDAVEAARRVSYAFNRFRNRYAERWDDFRPQKESLDALCAALSALDGEDDDA